MHDLHVWYCELSLKCLKKIRHCGTCVRLTSSLLLFVLGHTFGLCADCAILVLVHR